MTKAKNPQDQPAQSARFIETARTLGADEDEAAFKEKLAQIARQKPRAHEITPAQRKQIELEIAAAYPPKIRTHEDVEAELATAEADLARWELAFANYEGNNPNKHRATIRSARRKVDSLKAELGRNT